MDSGVGVLRVAAQPQGCLWEELLAVGVGVRALPSDLAAIDVLLADGGACAPIRELWRRRDGERGTSALTEGRPTVAMTTFVRMMVLHGALGLGAGVLVREVADSFHLRRLCPMRADRPGA